MPWVGIQLLSIPSGAFETDDLIEIDKRADRYYVGTYYPKKLPPPPATYYLGAIADKHGNMALTAVIGFNQHK